MKQRLILALAACVLAAGCAASYPTQTKLLSKQQIQSGQPQLVHGEAFGPWERDALPDIALAETEDAMGFDLRSRDVSKAELNAVRARLARVSFDTETKWPATLPDGFDPSALLDLGTNPGLGVRKLHQAGTTGGGVSIAIIDQSLLLDHAEYAGRVMTYETLHNFNEGAASMHGPAVTSIAAGKTCGVAPGARVYYIASTFGTVYKDGTYQSDLTYMAKGIRRVLELNTLLPEGQKIRAISISKGFEREEKGGEQVYKAIEEAKEQGVFVVTTSPEHNYGFELWGLGRPAAADPDALESYDVGTFWANSFYDGFLADTRMLLAPMDCRAVASFTAKDSYAYYSEGGLSWAVPWLAGMYALCVQENPALTPEQFIALALETGDTKTLEHAGKMYELGSIINPARLVGAAKAAG